MRILSLVLILMLFFQTGLAAAQENDIQPDGQVLLNTSNTVPPPSTDEYLNVAPGMLMSEDTVTTTLTAPDDQNVMTMEDVFAAYNRGEYDLVAKHLLPIANGSYPKAEELLGIMFYKGQGVPVDYGTAVDWLTKAADADRPLAQHYLANLTYAGTGTQQDPVTALMWLYMAIVHYPDGPEKDRALQDRANMASRLSRRDRLRAYEMAQDRLKKKDEAGLLEQAPPP